MRDSTHDHRSARYKQGAIRLERGAHQCTVVSERTQDSYNKSSRAVKPLPSDHLGGRDLRRRYDVQLTTYQRGVRKDLGRHACCRNRELDQSCRLPPFTRVASTSTLTKATQVPAPTRLPTVQPTETIDWRPDSMDTHLLLAQKNHIKLPPPAPPRKNHHPPNVICLPPSHSSSAPSSHLDCLLNASHECIKWVYLLRRPSASATPGK